LGSSGFQTTVSTGILPKIPSNAPFNLLEFLSKPRVLILDEATSNVDQQNEAKIERALDKLLEGRTAIIIAHRLATTRRADVIVVIDEQKIIEMGSHEELIQKKGSYFQMYETWEKQEEEKREEIL